ncbi:hypothetical protein Ptr902_12210 [Pyrenophora tritici-repentis]|nr:hypothetical protein L13192_07177 [Pyrenophora tritici-repentis]KAI2476331.1 hypothetical protein Ptr902_12210 [Pyrenophora tritici-repentis]
MRYTTATAFAAMMGMSALHAAPVGPNNPSGPDHLGMPMIYDDSSFQEKTVSQLHRRTPDHFKSDQYYPGSPAMNEFRSRFPNLGTVNVKRGEASTQRGRDRGFGKPVLDACGNCFPGDQITTPFLQKREASPQRGRGAVKAIKGIGGALGFLSDGLTIHNAVTQKREASFQRTHPGNTYENMPGLDTVEPNDIQQKRENLQNVATIDPNAIASLHNNGIPQKREASPSRIPIGDHTPGYTINFPNAGKDYSIGKREASPNRGDDNPISGRLATDPGYLKKENSKSIHETRDASRDGGHFSSKPLSGIPETDWDKVNEIRQASRPRDKSIHQLRSAPLETTLETDQLVHPDWIDHKPVSPLLQTREAAHDSDKIVVVHPNIFASPMPQEISLLPMNVKREAEAQRGQLKGQPKLPEAIGSVMPTDGTASIHLLKREAEAHPNVHISPVINAAAGLPVAIGSLRGLKREAEAQRNNGGKPYTNLVGELGINDKFGREPYTNLDGELGPNRRFSGKTLNEREAEPKNRLVAPSMNTDLAFNSPEDYGTFGAQKREAEAQRSRMQATDDALDALVIGYQKREAKAQRNKFVGNTPTSKCPGYTCVGGPPALGEVSIQMKYQQCCGSSSF